MIDNKLCLVCVFAIALSGNVSVADEVEIAQRVDRLEHIVNGQGLISLLNRVEHLQDEIKRLHGDNELLRHELTTLRRRQRELYLDLDVLLQAQAVTTIAAVEGPVLDEMIPDQIDVMSDDSVSINQTINTGDDATSLAVDHDENDYQSALQVLRSGEYEQAIDMLDVFIDSYPQSDYLPNAYYWQGEANYVLHRFDLAILSFQTVIDRFPMSNKVADALLKRGFSQYELDKVTEAESTLTTVIESYPDTPAARLAKVRLAIIKQEVR